MKSIKKAFTMVELIFVIVALGILASIALPRLGATKTDAEITASIANMHTLLSDISAYYAVKGNFEAKSNIWRILVASSNSFIPTTTAAKADLVSNVTKYISWNAITNVPLFNDKGKRISSEDTVDKFVYLKVNNKNCISVAVSGNILLFKSEGSSAACNAVKNETTIAELINNKILDENGNPIALNGANGGVLLGGLYALLDNITIGFGENNSNGNTTDNNGNTNGTESGGNGVDNGNTTDNGNSNGNNGNSSGNNGNGNNGSGNNGNGNNGNSNGTEGNSGENGIDNGNITGGNSGGTSSSGGAISTDNNNTINIDEKKLLLEILDVWMKKLFRYLPLYMKKNLMMDIV